MLDAYEAFQLRPVLDSREAISAWRGRGPFHLEIDTGMGRSGVRDVDAVRDLLDTDAFEGAFTHFHSADIDPKSIPPQLERFQQAVKRLPRRPPLLHAANSPAALRDQAYALDLVRPGIFLYGGEAADDLPKPTPVVSWRARVTSVRQLAKGDTVSYRAEWTAPKATSVATLSVGYADGLPRSLQGRGEVLLGGKRRPIVGRLTMDMIVVDVGGDAPRLGDVATLIGKDGEESITLDEMARAAGTNSYEILTGLGKRLPRVYG